MLRIKKEVLFQANWTETIKLLLFVLNIKTLPEFKKRKKTEKKREEKNTQKDSPW